MTAPGPDARGGWEAAAIRELVRAFGPDEAAPASGVASPAGWTPGAGVAPGRVTLVGDHVDYVGGRIACSAVDRVLAVAVRPSADGRWRAASGDARVERAAPLMSGDLGDRLFAAAVVLRRLGVPLPALEMAVVGDLPSAAGLSSSAAVVTAALVAMLRLAGKAVSAEDLVAAALTAERDVVGVPCGELDQRSVVHSRAGSVLVLDCARSSWRHVAWPWPEIGLLVAAGGESHDVGGEGYRRRRQAAERACAALRVASCQEIGDRWTELDDELRRCGRHIATETRRTDAAEQALYAADAAALGRLMDQSHESLRRDFGVSTPRLDAMVAAARRVPGCYGARLTGAGFGGSVVALVDRGSAAACAAAMVAAGGVGGAWPVQPADGLELTATDVVIAT